MSNSFFLTKNIKNINKYINSLLEKNLNKLKFENLLNIARSNKIIFTFVVVMFIFLSYLLVPTFFKQQEVSRELERELLNTFKLNINFSEDLKYNFFPRPHFTIKKALLMFNQDEISNIEEIKIYVSLDNLFSLKNMELNDVIINEANFNLNKNNSNFFLKILDNNFKNSSLKIHDSNLFFRNEKNEVLFINKIINMKYYYDAHHLKNIIYLQNEIFNTPYSIEFFKIDDEKKYYSELNISNLKLKIENIYNYGNEIKNGSANILFNKNKSLVNYKLKQNLFEFRIFDKLDDSKFLYNGNINLKPFFSNLEGNVEKLNLSYLFNSNGIIQQLLSTEIFHNKNIEFGLSINADKILNFNSFTNMILNFKIQDGLIDIDNTKFEWKNYATFNLYESLIYNKNGELFLDGKTHIVIKDYNGIYRFLVTPKNYRKKIKIIDLNYIYNFDQDVMQLQNIKINGKFNEKVNLTIDNIIIKDNNLKNKIYLKNLINKAIKNYDG